MPCLVRRRCKRLLAERDEARAQGYAEAALAVEQGIEIDRLREFFSFFYFSIWMEGRWGVGSSRERGAYMCRPAKRGEALRLGHAARPAHMTRVCLASTSPFIIDLHDVTRQCCRPRQGHAAGSPAGGPLGGSQLASSQRQVLLPNKENWGLGKVGCQLVVVRVEVWSPPHEQVSLPTIVPLCTAPMGPPQVAEGQLLATYRDEAAADLIQVRGSVVGFCLWLGGAFAWLAGRWEWRFGWGAANHCTKCKTVWPAYKGAQFCAVASLGAVHCLACLLPHSHPHPPPHQAIV